MAVVVLASAGGAPGVTTAALAMALNWPGAVVLAECDPAGGSILSGMWQGAIQASQAGLVPYALAAQRDPGAAADAIFSRAIPLEETPAARFVLPAAPGPDFGRQLASAWPAVADSFALAGPDIIADIGRFDGDPALAPLLSRAAKVLLVCRPSIRQAAAAKPRLAAMARVRAADGLLIIGAGRYRPALMARELETPLAGELPADTATAGFLADGGELPRRFLRSPLIRAAARQARRLAGETAGTPAASKQLPEVART